MAPKRASLDAGDAPQRSAKRRQTMATMRAVKCATNEDLVDFVHMIWTKYPALREEVREFFVTVEGVLDEFGAAAKEFQRKFRAVYGEDSLADPLVNFVKDAQKKMARETDVTPFELRTFLADFIFITREMKLKEIKDPRCTAAKNRVLEAVMRAKQMLS
uniref:Uncharacterized protein n=1 Tax=Alexandrium andersonii TaxID=327968 RepID=A0A7S2DYQ6_9DINO